MTFKEKVYKAMADTRLTKTDHKSSSLSNSSSGELKEITLDYKYYVKPAAV